MATEFRDDAEIVREITIKTPDPALPPKTFVLSMTAAGVKARKAGAREDDAHFLSWKTILGIMLVHEARI